MAPIFNRSAHLSSQSREPKVPLLVSEFKDEVRGTKLDCGTNHPARYW
jgi:hypothetical protein